MYLCGECGDHTTIRQVCVTKKLGLSRIKSFRYLLASGIDRPKKELTKKKGWIFKATNIKEVITEYATISKVQLKTVINWWVRRQEIFWWSGDVSLKDMGKSKRNEKKRTAVMMTIIITSGDRDPEEQTNVHVWPWNVDDERKKNSQSINPQQQEQKTVL